ncbi:MAG: MBOAT family protein [Sphingobacteriales bacterium]|nr:MBOAT family protein [Sphingobacteriales bacterium]
MLFNTLSYFVFLPVVVILFYSLPVRYRWMLLLVASYFFYACWEPAFLLLILLTTLIVYLTARLVEKENRQPWRKCWLWVGILVNLSILAVFKYAGFFQTILSDLKIIKVSHSLNILLPVGISFYTFQALAYLIDVYRRQLTAEKHFGHFALFISFFPQLVAGPIERASRLIPQLKKSQTIINMADVSAGVKYLIYGLFKKVVIADNLSMWVNEVFQNPSIYNGFHYLVAAVLFTIQIYCDFSAYSDMAVGSARLLGIRLIQNFNLPFSAVSVSDFWKRWHISLSSWFRDYVFLPLAWKVSKWKWLNGYSFLNNVMVYSVTILFTFFLTGLWHGADYTFVIWGLLHGLCLIIEFSTKKIRIKFLKKIGINRKSNIYTILSRMLTFSFVVFAFIFFRADNLKEAIWMIKGIFSEWGAATFPEIPMQQYFMGGLAGLALLIFFENSGKNISPESFLSGKKIWLRWGFFYLLLAFIFMTGYFGNIEFIYFQF